MTDERKNGATPPPSHEEVTLIEILSDSSSELDVQHLAHDVLSYLLDISSSIPHAREVDLKSLTTQKLVGQILYLAATITSFEDIIDVRGENEPSVQLIHHGRYAEDEEAELMEDALGEEDPLFTIHHEFLQNSPTTETVIVTLTHSNLPLENGLARAIRIYGPVVPAQDAFPVRYEGDAEFDVLPWKIEFTHIQPIQSDKN